ncbi:hypothetical protein [Aestuariivirga sp.]|uniref:hypothetical protein n=1 Tax=Aestuariivirga sp. TaxID=2650926 RepID=UPI0035934E31
MKVPAAYELKALYHARRSSFDELGEIRGLVSAPVYVFPDQDVFDSDKITELCRSTLDQEICLPHEQVIFEVKDKLGECESYILYCRNLGPDAEAFLLIKGVERNLWVGPLMRLIFRVTGELETFANPRHVHEDAAVELFAYVSAGMYVRALNILAMSPEIHSASLPLPGRRKCEKAGVTGWVWHTVSIDPSKLTVRGPGQGGTHASPRWHIRRGHWRNLAGGRRVFVRECEVGDMSRGGVVKDYEVAA